MELVDEYKRVKEENEINYANDKANYENQIASLQSDNEYYTKKIEETENILRDKEKELESLPEQYQDNDLQEKLKNQETDIINLNDKIKHCNLLNETIYTK